mmetsp:Transcript_40845/g.102557  ORF Transcript_40845/g.102557 Transcript_40845/m.102557 type:complete len:222 (+) Transcript_40845:58-723(+)
MQRQLSRGLGTVCTIAREIQPHFARLLWKFHAKFAISFTDNFAFRPTGRHHLVMKVSHRSHRLRSFLNQVASLGHLHSLSSKTLHQFFLLSFDTLFLAALNIIRELCFSFCVFGSEGRVLQQFDGLVLIFGLRIKGRLNEPPRNTVLELDLQQICGISRATELDCLNNVILGATVDVFATIWLTNPVEDVRNGPAWHINRADLWNSCHCLLAFTDAAAAVA